MKNFKKEVMKEIKNYIETLKKHTPFLNYKLTEIILDEKRKIAAGIIRGEGICLLERNQFGMCHYEDILFLVTSNKEIKEIKKERGTGSIFSLKPNYFKYKNLRIDPTENKLKVERVNSHGIRSLTFSLNDLCNKTK